MSGAQMASSSPCFTENVAASTRTRLEIESPLTGEIVEIMFQFPASNYNLDITVLRFNDQVFPDTGESLTLEDTTVIYRNLHIPIAKSDELAVLVVNNDLVNAHQLTVIPTINGVP